MRTFSKKQINFIFLLFLISAVIAIYSPVFYAEYLYTDEANQIWLYKEGYNYATSVPQGRYLTFGIFEWLFSYVDTIKNVIYARLFSLFGWILCLPIWLYILNRVTEKNGHSNILVMFIMVYLITMPPFTIYIGWSSCMQMFIPCTSALIGGYVLYDSIKFSPKLVSVSTFSGILSIAFGLIALFTYQSCYGCFFIPFVLHFLSTKKITKTLLTGFAFALLTFIIYFLIFKFTLLTNSISITNRSSFAVNPINKLLFLFTRPVASAFHFTYIFNEKSITGLVVYIVLAITWTAINLFQQRANTLSDKIAFYIVLTVFLVLVYLPSLIVKENYSSNRTLFALNIFIFILVADTIFSVLKNYKSKCFTACIISLLFLLNAWYNFNIQFLKPLKIEYNLLKNIISERYTPAVQAVYFIRPSEDAFKIKFGITPSWDEFGVPSTAKIWVPEPLVKQLLFEKTGNRQIAESVIIKSWINKVAFEQSGQIISDKIVLIDMETELAK